MNTRRTQRKCKLGSIFLFAVCTAGSAWGQIHIAQVAPISSAIVDEGRETNIGIKLAFDSVNAHHGIAGQKIILRTEDDEYDSKKAVTLIRELVKTDTLALLGVVGSPTMAMILQEKIPETAGMPIIGTIPGAEPFRKPLNPYVFHVRAGDADQYRVLVRNALTIGMKRIAVVYLDTPSVKSGVATVEVLLKAASLELVARVPIPLKANANYGEVIKVLKEARPHLIVLHLPGQVAGEFVRAYGNRGMAAQITSLSYGNPNAICQVATPELARGISLAQIFPNVNNKAVPLVRQFREDFLAYGPKGMKPSPLQFEGYITAKVLIEGIKRIDGTPTREKLVKALNSMHQIDLGGFVIDFSATKHNGSEYVETGVLTKACSVLY